MICTGQTARELFESNIEDRYTRVSGYFRNGNYWIAYDNNSREMFVEDFKEEKDAVAWLNGFDVILDEKIKVRQIFPKFYYISKNIFLKATIKDEVMTSKVYRF